LVPIENHDDLLTNKDDYEDLMRKAKRLNLNDQVIDIDDVNNIEN